MFEQLFNGVAAIIEDVRKGFFFYIYIWWTGRSFEEMSNVHKHFCLLNILDFFSATLHNNLNTVIFFLFILQSITAVYSIGRQWQHFEWRDLCVQDCGERSSGQGRRPSNPRQNHRGMWPTLIYVEEWKDGSWCAVDGEVGSYDSCCLPHKNDNSKERQSHH